MSKRDASLAVEPKQGDEFSQFLEESYKELRKLARAHLRRNINHTLSATELVHELYLKMGQKQGIPIVDRHHFISVAMQCMRWILLDYAKAKRSGKRGAGAVKIQLDENLHPASHKEYVDLVALHQALEKLALISAQACQVAELRFLMGLEVAEVSKTLGVSEATVKREWQFAKAWLTRELEGKDEG